MSTGEARGHAASRVRWLTMLGVAIGGVAVVADLVLMARSGIRSPADYADPAILVPVFWAAGAIAAGHRPHLVCARLLAAAGSLIAVSHALAALPPAVHGSALWPVNLASRVLFVAGFAAWGCLLAVFPDGRIETRAERLWIRWLPVVAVVVGTVGFFNAPSQPLIGVLAQPATTLPFWWHGLTPVADLTPVLFAAPVLGLVLLGSRVRRASGRRRAQMRLPLAASGAAAIALLGSAPIGALLGDDVQSYVFVVAVSSVPVALMAGMVRDGLFELNRFALRSLAYGVLWVMIALGYAALAAVLGVSSGERLPIAPAVAVGVLAAVVFAPARTRLERAADRWVYGRRLSDQESLRTLGHALEQAGETADVAQLVAETVRRALRCAWVTVRIDGREAGYAGPAGTGSESEGPASTGPGAENSAAATLTDPVRYAGASIGEIVCAEPSDADPALVEHLARQIAPVLHNAQLARALAVQVEELTASRARLVHAEETERRRIERDLHDGVQAQLTAIAARVDLARLQQANAPQDLPATLDLIADAVRATHSDLREFVRGIHPAVLEDHGLVRAIEATAATLPLTVQVDADAASRSDRLPRHAEGAAYFFAVEGLMNVVRHAGTDHAVVEVRHRAGELSVRVRDHGSGFTAGRGADEGGGLHGLSDRLQALGGRVQVTSVPGQGTDLVGVLPVSQSA